MDIDLLSKMVKELILDNDRVVLPGLGSFVAEIVPSSFTDKGYTINPPYRRLYFRSRPDQGEELAKFYSDTNQVELAVADKIVMDFIAELKSVLHVKKTVIFPGLGRLRATKENTVFFVADEDLDIYPDGFGLEPISLKTHQETREEVTAAVVGLKSILEETSEPEAEQPVIMEPEIVVDIEPVHENVVDIEPVLEEIPDPVVESVQDSSEGAEIVGETVEVVEAVEAVEEMTEAAVEDTPEVCEDAVNVGAVPPVKKNFWKIFGKILLWIVVAAAALILIYVSVSRLCPGILDSVLYTPEELQIIKNI